jgi:hypothetical protein
MVSVGYVGFFDVFRTTSFKKKKCFLDDAWRTKTLQTLHNPTSP